MLNEQIFNMKNIAVFASGSGTNAQKIIDHFKAGTVAHVVLVVTNNPTAFVLERAKKAHIPTLLIDKKTFLQSAHLLDELKKHEIDFIVLAGFLWLIPAYLIKAYPGKIVNIHPALLPKYGGKGMYGDKVHEAVIQNKETESGITIHYVNEYYDEGQVIFQAKCPVYLSDTPQTLAKKIHQLEHTYFPTTIEAVLI